MTLILFLIMGYVLAAIYELLMTEIGKKIKVDNGLVVNGYLLHHSLYGLFFIIAGFLFSDLRIQMIAFGIGIIIQHYFTGDGLVFITKGRKKVSR